MTELLFKYQQELDKTTKTTIPELDKELIPQKQLYHKCKLDEKNLLAILKVKYDNGKMSQSRLDNIARASREYQDFISHYIQAQSRFIEIETKKNTLLNRCDAIRTFISLEKEKMKIL